MKRAGKLFLMIILVLAMVLTSTGVSNVMSVFAETQSVEESKEKASTSTGTEEQQKSKQPSSEKDGKKEEDAVEGTTASKAKEETTAKKEETTTQEASTEAETKKEEAATQEKKAESTTAAKKKTAKSKIATQDAAEAAKEGSDSNSSNQNIARAAKIDIATCITAVDMSVTINGKKTALDDLPEGTLVPRGAPVSITVKFDNVDHALENLGEGTVLYYQLPEQIEIVAAQQGDLTEEGKVVGKFTISKKGLVEITFTEGYLTDCGGKIEQGSFWLNGSFNKEFGGKGQETIIFGPVKKTIHFDPKLEEDKTNLDVTKEITKFDAKTQKLTYTITVTAPADNTQTVKDVKVTDVFADNSLKMLENLYKDIKASKGTLFDAKTGIWTIGDMKKGEVRTLTYSVTVKDSWDDTITDKTISNTATVTAGTEKKAEVTSKKVFNNNLNITKSTVDGTYGTSKGIHVDATGTWIKYTITVNASNVNQDDASGVKVTDIFSDNKEDIEQYYAIEGATKTNRTEPRAGEIYIDNNKKDFIWNIGTMEPGETKTLTYCVKLKDSVWENSGNTSDTVKKKFTNKATLTATGMEEDKSATTTVNLKKKWISKKGEWDATTGKMKFTVKANEGDNNSPVLDRNFTFTDKMTGDYKYTGNLEIVAKDANGNEQWQEIISLEDSDKQEPSRGTFTWNTDGGWTYKASQAGEYIYYLTYYAKPTKSGHNYVNNTASVGINGSSYEYKANWSGTGSTEIALTKEYISGVTTGKMKWRTTIPVRVVKDSTYVDTPNQNHKFASEEELRKNLAVYFGEETAANKLTEGTNYTLTRNGDRKFTITFLDEIDASNDKKIIITYYTENTVKKDDKKYKEGDYFTYANTGELTIRAGQSLKADDSAVWYKHSSISKEAGDYDKKNHTIRWFITLNKDGTLGTLDGTGENNVATVTDTLPEGLKYVTNGNTQNIQITEKGRQAAQAAIDSNSIKYDEASRKLTFNVTGLKSDSKNSNEGYVKIAIDTLVDDEYIGLYTKKEYNNTAKVEYGKSSTEATATKTIKNTTLKKDSEYINGSTATYTLTVNPNGENLLKEKDTITVVDQMPKIMTLLSDSITVNGESLAQSGCTFTTGTGDEDHNEYRFTVPDDEKVVIKYKVTINATEDTAVTLSNTAWYEGVENTAVNNSKEIIVLRAGAEIIGSRSFYILKVDSQTQKPIKGAEFTLEKAEVENGKITGFETVMNEGNKTKTTGEDGKIKFTGLNKDGLYCVTEVKAASGYKNSGKKIYVAFTKAMQELGTNEGYTVNGTTGGGTIQVENTPTGSLTIEKKVIGNNIPDETYQMVVTANTGNVDKDLTKATVTATKTATGTTGSETITPDSATTEGTLTFHLKADHKAKVSGLPVGTYNVTENAASQKETDKTAYTASYSVDGDSVSNVEVTVAQDVASSRVPNVTVTNTYKTELKVLKKDIGTDASLSGAQLAIYNNSDVTFDSEGKATVKDGATAVASWTSGTDAKDLTGKVVAGGNYVLVETAVPTSDYVQAAAIPFKVDAEGRIQVADAYANNYDDSTHTITLSNQKKTGSLTVKKIIEDGEEKAAFDFDVTFTKFNNGNGGTVTVVKKDKDGKQKSSEEKTVGNDGVLSIGELADGESAEITGIPYGTTYEVKEDSQVKNGQLSYLLTESEGLKGTIGDGEGREEKANATITNTRLTGFVVQKNVTNGQYVPNAESQDKKEFIFDVSLTRKSQPYAGTFKLQYSNERSSNEIKTTDGSYQIKLKDGQSAAFSDLPSGVEYIVKEVEDTKYTTKVNDKNVTDARGTIKGTGDMIVFTNTRKLGTFSFTKTVKGNTQDKEQSYDFYVEVDGKPFNGNAAITQKDTEKSDDADTQDKAEEDKSENTAGTTVKITDGKLSLKDGQTATIANIPAGVSYSIKETTGDRYVTLINNKVTAETTGTVEEGKTSETQFINQVIHLNVTKTDLTGQKEVAGATMTLYKAEDVNEDGTVKDGAKALDSWISGEDSFYDFGPVIRVGESYVLIETAAPDGYTYAENISFTVNEDGTIKTDAEKITDKETGEDIYLVKDDVTRVSVKKMDITGQKEVAGARLLLKDKDGNVIESWMSTTEAHVFEQKLIAGETYTLTEVTAPSGYEVAADITFTVNKDGTVSVDGKAVDGNEIVMKDETTPVGEEGKLVVSKLVTFQGRNQAVNRTFYVALFSDADCTKKVSNVKELKCEGAWSAYTVFEHLKDGTYYVAETDEEGNKLESSEACKIEGNGTKCAITPTQKTAYAVIENQLLIPGDDFLNTLHDLTVTKNVTLDGNPISDKYNGTFYVSLFTDPYYTNRIDDVKALQIQNGKSTSVSFIDLADGTYYVAETDKDGNPVENTDFGFDVTYDGDIAVSFTEENTDSTLGITNDMTERNPEYDKYLKEKDDNNGDDDKNKNNTSNHSSNKTTKKGKNSKTGDYSHILFYAVLAAAALVVGSAEMYRRTHGEARRKNKHNR